MIHLKSLLTKGFILGIVFMYYGCREHECPKPSPNKSKTLTLQPGSEGKDALLSGLYPNNNFGTYHSLHARAWTVSGNLSLEKGIIQFDYSALPAGAVITKATLTLFADTTYNYNGYGHNPLSGPNDWVLKRVIGTWDEATVTWNNAPATDLVNQIRCAPSTSNSQPYILDATKMVKDEIANPTLYFGFLMEINNTSPYRAITFCSTDNAAASIRPKMVIEYKK